MKRIIYTGVTALGVILVLSCHRTSEKYVFSDSSVLLSDSLRRADCVYLTTDEKRRPVISWCETDEESRRKYFFMAFYKEDSNAFSSPVSIPIEQNTSFHEEGMPKIAVKGNGTVMAVYETAAPTKNNEWAGFIHYVVSADKGVTWTPPLCLHADTLPGKSRSFAGVTRLADGEIGAAWLDESLNHKKEGRPVKFAKTAANNRFQNELIVDSLACECCRVAISSSGNDKISIVFRDIDDSVRDVALSISSDSGKSFMPALSFGSDNWVINGCPHNGPAVVNTSKNIYTVWYTGGTHPGIYYCELNDKGKTIVKRLVSDRGRFIQLCLLPDGSRLLAYNEHIQSGDSSYNKIVLDRVDGDKVFTTNVVSHRPYANYPVIQSVGSNKVVVAWKEKDKIYYKVKSVNL